MISEERLREAAHVAGIAFANSLPEPDYYSYEFSPRFEKKMRRVIRRGNHPAVYRELQRVAGFLIAIIISGCIWLTVDVEAREVFFGWVSQWTEGAWHYFLPKEASGTSKTRYVLQEIPEGYVLLHEYHGDDGSAKYVFKDNEGHFFRFEYILSSDLEYYLLTYTEKRCPTTVNGNDAMFYPAESENNSNSLVWTDDETGALLSVHGFFDMDNLVHWAEKIRKEQS